MRRIAIIGAGAWGTALAVLAAKAGRDVYLYARRADFAAELAEKRRNERYLPGIALPAAIAIGADFDRALSADALLYVQPAQAFRDFLRALPIAKSSAPLAICAKGLDRASGQNLVEIAAAERPALPIAMLSGPSFAAEAAQGKPTAIVIAAREAALAERLAAALASANFRPYVSTDPQGVALAGAVKNVLAIACGIVMGLGLGENARAALIARGLAETQRLILAVGGRAETAMGLAGLGDLVLTCASAQSRNFALGRALGAGADLARALDASAGIVEGVATAPALLGLAESRGVAMPIAAAIARVLDDPATLAAEIEGLLARPLARES